VKNSTSRSQYRHEIEALARRFHRDLQLAFVDPVDLGDIVQDLHLDVTRSPAFAIREPVANLRYPMTRGSNHAFARAVEKFIEDFLNGSLQPTIESEPLPPKHSEESLVKIVGLNYQDIVMDRSRDVLVVFCISPCGPCEAFQPTLESLAALYTEMRSISALH
jgi:protein disulfide-isomerase A1